MSQNIRIGVDASTGGAEDGIRNIKTATEGATDAARQLGAESDRASQKLDKAAQAAERLRKAKDALSRETGTSISDEDASLFLDNFDRLKKGKNVGSRRMRQFDDFEGWWQGHQLASGSANAAAQHRRSVIASGLQGTNYARLHGAPPPPTPPSDPGDGGGFGAGPALRRAGSIAGGIVKGGLALAGINGIMSLVGGGVSKAGDEAISTDTLKRQLGDLGVDFMRLRDGVRASTEGLGLAYDEAQKLAGSFARESGSKGVGDLEGNLRRGVGVSRAYGLDPSAGVGFFATMRRTGVAGDDQSSRKLALMIGDAIEKGGYAAKADEVLSAIAGYSDQASRLALSTPNSGAFSSYLTALMATGRPGLDPSGAASLLTSADSAVRRGGAMGEASLNFSLAALMRSSPSLNPISAKAMMEGGLFGTTGNVFGRGSILGEWYNRRGVATPGLDDTTNFEKMMPMLREQYGANSPYLLEAIKNHFGLNSLSQAAAFDDMRPADLTASMDALGRAGVDPAQVNATGIQTIAKIANTDRAGDLAKLFDAVRARSDVTDQDRAVLDGAMAASVQSGTVDALKDALISVVGTKEQEQTEGERTRSAVTGVENAITRYGAVALPYLNAIRGAIDVVARVLSPGYRDAQADRQRAARVDEANGEVSARTPGAVRQAQGVTTNPNVGGYTEYEKRDPRARAEFNRIAPVYMGRLRAAHRRSPNGEVDLDDVIRAPDPELLERTDNKAHWEKEYYRQLAVRQHVEREYAKLRPQASETHPNQANRAAFEAIGGGGRVAPNAGHRDYTDAIIGPESNGDPNARNRDSSAAGLGQFIRSTWHDADLKRRAGYAGTDERTWEALRSGRQGVQAQRRMTQAYAERNVETWRARRGSEPTQGEVYGMHFMDPEPYMRLDDAARRTPDVSAASLFPRQAGSNRNIFYHDRGRGAPRSAAEVRREILRRGGSGSEGSDPGTAGGNAAQTVPVLRTVTVPSATPMPNGSRPSDMASEQRMAVSFAPATVRLEDASGRPRGQVTLNPFTQSPASGR